MFRLIIISLSILVLIGGACGPETTPKATPEEKAVAPEQPAETPSMSVADFLSKFKLIPYQSGIIVPGEVKVHGQVKAENESMVLVYDPECCEGSEIWVKYPGEAGAPPLNAYVVVTGAVKEDLEKELYYIEATKIEKQ